jgi:hypothetical protein
MMRRMMLLATISIAAPATAAPAADEPRPRIAVTGSGRVMTAPDLATVDYRIVGEGPTSDAAVTALVVKRDRIGAGLASLDRRIEPRAGEVAVAEVRSPDCRQDDGQPRLSTGACAVIGYVATLGLTIRTAAVKQAGTLVGLIGRLGGSDPHLTGFALAEPGAAQRQAIAAALADAKAKAQAVAQGTGATLGRLIAASTGGYDAGAQDIVVTGVRVGAPAAPPPPPPPPPPIAVDLNPRPIETQAQVSVSYEIGS